MKEYFSPNGTFNIKFRSISYEVEFDPNWTLAEEQIIAKKHKTAQKPKEITPVHKKLKNKK